MPLRYALLHEIPGQARDLIRLHGPDTLRFVQGTVSADVAQIPEDEAVASGLLTVKGKLVSEVLVASGGPESVVLLVPAAISAEVATLLDRHIIMDEVEVEALGQAYAAIVWTDDGEVKAGPGVRSHRVRHPAPGRLVWGDAPAVDAALAGAQKMDAAAFDLHRVQTGTPAWGREIEAGHFPPEVGFVYGVDYDKGCYMGQEPLARIHARGQVNWVMVEVQSDVAPPTQRRELSHPDRPSAGRWTTAVRDGAQTIGLAIVRREFAKAGVVLRTTAEPAADVTVTSGPLGDDPGMGKLKAATVKLGGPR